MGTPAFALPALEALAASGHTIVCVVTQPDRPRDRGKHNQPSPVAARAAELGLPLAKPASLKAAGDLFPALEAEKPDLAVVVAYGKILPPVWLALPRLGCINIHGSLLPAYRGAAPVQRAVLAGEPETGVTLMYLSEGMDEGDTISSRSTPVDRKTSGELLEELARMGAALLLETLPAIFAGTAPRTPQDHANASYAPMLRKEDGSIVFTDSAAAIERQIRAMQPWPVARALYRGEPIRFLEAIVRPAVADATPGQILAADRNGLDIATGQGVLRVTKLQAPGKRAMEVSEYCKGNRIEIGSVME